MPFITAFEKITPLSIQCKAAIHEVAQLQSLPKGGRAMIDQELYYLESGLIRVVYQADAKEITSRFEYQGRFFMVVKNFPEQDSPLEYMEALENSQLRTLKSADLQTLLADFPELNLHFKLLYEKYLCMYDARMHLLYEPDPTKQYEGFLQLYPNLAHRLQVQHIAQFLNVHPSTLSKVRKKLKQAKN